MPPPKTLKMKNWSQEEGKESNNICIDRNCHQNKSSKKSLPNAQELFWVPPSDKGLCIVPNSFLSILSVPDF